MNKEFINELVITHGFSKRNAEIAYELYILNKLNEKERDFIYGVIHKECTDYFVPLQVINHLNYRISKDLNGSKTNKATSKN